MIKVLFADDHEMVRIGVSSYLSAQPDIDVIAEADDGTEAVALALELKPDIILMDLVMREMDGIEATKKITAEWPEAKIIIVTSFLDDEKVYPALEAGATSYMLKTSKASEIAKAIRATYSGQSILEPEVTGKIMSKMRQPSSPQLHEQLTEREIEVLRLMTEGKNNQQIADELFIALKTVKVHVSNILSKLDVQDRTQAVIYAFNQKLYEK
ncbi:response regulator transcription factor [Salipaludibacillus agaradhaerens]|uniref:Response regulator transcription factor n=1 Tax=Salipaludibacillus agaradhaerens TaxID=76935 RepID=A0A9Q4AZP6_SALAG|nr:response regulator transcription factor [Salipaludibacillus agaradhaerens]UJW58509.1 response regulator transcription factor [Bacillus sp. A116_S68]MCR6095654.1 response regulator transcription factor [Salipaludibacillus agaradhaerens]MCR6107455.1 response regulator transcription factor [Salipaludibacillus agaradhaerens]MCR6114786.1 response regulator transcription factor [Salipaludibacillus agaradhaerens]MCR6119484.1 response regulator transcription factor [Salipaludibacillus agaradhaerens